MFYVLDEVNNKKKKTIIISLIIAAIIGILFFIASCIYYVKKGHVIIIEKMQEYYKTCSHGWYWFFPFAYRKVGQYKLEDNKLTFTLNNGKKAEVIYNITDVKLFHYTKKPVGQYINEITLFKENIDFDYLKTNLQNIGIELISISQIKTIYDN